MLKVIVATLIVVLWIGVILWAANYPFGSPWKDDYPKPQLEAIAAQNRRHHFIVFMSSLVIVSVSLGILAVSEFAEPDGDDVAGVALAVISAGCLGLFAAIVRSRRRRRQR